MPPSHGHIKYDHDGVAIPAEEVFRHLSIAAPYQELIEEFTLEEMVRFHFRFKQPRAARAVPEILDVLELSHASAKLISHFSSGMKQRLKLGLAFLSDVNLLFLDEPTTNLDKKSTQWYNDQLTTLPGGVLLLIASNQEHEYPAHAHKIDISAYK